MEKYKVGEDVVYNNHRWTIESIEREKMHGINPETDERSVEVSVRYRLARLRRTPSCVFELVWTMAPEEQIENVPHELTAAEYAEKLKAVFGDGAKKALMGEDYDSCGGVKCAECPFRREKLLEVGFCGNCGSLVWYSPSTAISLMDEWLAERDKPKGKRIGKISLRNFRMLTVRPPVCRCRAGTNFILRRHRVRKNRVKTAMTAGMK